MTPTCCGQEMRTEENLFAWTCDACGDIRFYDPPDRQLQVQPARAMTSTERRGHTEFLNRLGRPF